MSPNSSAARARSPTASSAQHEFAGLRAGHPRLVADAPGAEAGNHENIPVRCQPLAARRRPRTGRREPGSTSPSRTCSCRGTPRDGRRPRARAGRRRVPSRAAARPGTPPGRSRTAGMVRAGAACQQGINSSAPCCRPLPGELAARGLQAEHVLGAAAYRGPHRGGERLVAGDAAAHARRRPRGRQLKLDSPAAGSVTGHPVAFGRYQIRPGRCAARQPAVGPPRGAGELAGRVRPSRLGWSQGSTWPPRNQPMAPSGCWLREDAAAGGEGLPGREHPGSDGSTEPGRRPGSVHRRRHVSLPGRATCLAVRRRG